MKGSFVRLKLLVELTTNQPKTLKPYSKVRDQSERFPEHEQFFFHGCGGDRARNAAWGLERRWWEVDNNSVLSHLLQRPPGPSNHETISSFNIYHFYYDSRAHTTVLFSNMNLNTITS